MCITATSEMKVYLLRYLPHLDCSTLALFSSERLLKAWLHEKNHETLDKLSQEHPYFSVAMEKALDIVVTRKMTVPPKQSGNAYSVDTLSDDSDDESSMQEGYSGQQQRPGGSRDQTSGLRGQGRANTRRAITNAMLQAALEAAYSEQNQAATTAFGPQLAIMREMGLCDERACIQALVRTGGDVDMAVDLLLSD